MNPDKPKYLTDLPRERPGHYIIIAIALVLAIAIYGALKIYAGTVSGWEKRFNQPATHTAIPPPARASNAHATEKLPAPVALKPDKCINGTPFRRLPDGGWENIKGVRCK